PMVAKTALQILAPGNVLPWGGAATLYEAVQKRISDASPRLRLDAIEALGALPALPDEPTVRTLVRIYPDLNDQWSQSAAIGVAAKDPLKFIEAALASNNPGALKTLIE